MLDASDSVPSTIVYTPMAGINTKTVRHQCHEGMFTTRRVAYLPAAATGGICERAGDAGVWAAVVESM